MNRCTDWQKLASLGPEMRILPQTKANEWNRDKRHQSGLEEHGIGFVPFSAS
jgi:hypothetical protein